MTVRPRSAAVLRPRPGPGLSAGVRGLLLALIAWLTLTVALMPSLMPSMWALDAGAAPPAVASAAAPAPADPSAHHAHPDHLADAVAHVTPDASGITANSAASHAGHSASGPQHCPWCHLNHHLALPVTALLVLPWPASVRGAGPVLAALRLPAAPPRLRPPAQGPPV